MKNIILWLLIVFCIVGGCKKYSQTPTEPNQDNNLITNSSFEMNGVPSIAGWKFWSNVTSSVDFSNDTPPSGGSWSVALSVGDLIGKYLQTKVPAPVGQNRFRLSVWSKAIWSEPRGNPGFVSLAINNTVYASINIVDSVWRYYESINTLTVNAGDSITVTLDAGDAYGIQRTYFDLCRLELLK